MNKILVIDDDEGILEAFELMLIDAGYQVKTSTKDDKYITELIQIFHPDLIILDLLLSGESGRNVCKKLKSQKTTKHIPIIMISAHPDAQDTALEAGADAFVAKPFDMQDILEKIAKYMAHNEKKPSQK